MQNTPYFGAKLLKNDAPGFVQPPKWSRPRNDPRPWNDPQIDPEMIPTFLLVDPEMIPKELGNGD